MASTAAIGSGADTGPARSTTARATTLRNLGLAFILLAIALGVMIALQGEPALGLIKLGQLQARSIAWAIPGIAVFALLFSYNYPRTGAVVSLLGAGVAMLSILGGGYGGAPPAEGYPPPQLEGLTATMNQASFLLLALVAAVLFVVTLSRLGVFSARRTMIAYITVAVVFALSLAGLHIWAKAPASVWANGVPYVLTDGHNPILLGVIVSLWIASILSLSSIAANNDDVRLANVRNGETVRPDWITRFGAAKIASIPLFLVVLGVFIGGTIWTIVFSFTGSTGFPVMDDWVGWKQYERLLFRTPRWSISVKVLAIYGVLSLIFSFLVGFLLAVFMDQKIRFESAFRTIYLYPFALSFIVTGHVWAWIMNPTMGLQKAVRDLGWSNFEFSWLGDRDWVVYALVLAGLWQGTGLIMALMLAGLRGIDEEVWKAARVDGIPKWRTYISIVLPMMRPVLITTLVITASGIVRVYDLVVSLTQGGPGLFSEVPAKYVYDYMFQGNLAQGLAASTIMLLTVGIIIIPWAIVEFGGKRK
jgi:glucose/mannose transport system permease protein